MLLYELNTAFRHGWWDRYDYLSLLKKDGNLWNKDYYHRTTNHYSVPQDCFYALSGKRPLVLEDQPNLMFWHKVVHKEWFGKIQDVFNKSEIGKIISIHELTTLIEEGIEDEEEEELTDQDENSGEGEEKEKEEEEKENGSDGDDGDGDEEWNDETSNNSNHTGPEDSGGNDETEDNESEPESDQGNDREENYGDDDGRIGPSGKKLSMSSSIEDRAKEMAESLEEKVQAVENLLDYVDPSAGVEDFPMNLENTINFVSGFDVKRMMKFFGFAKNAVRGAHRNGDAAVGEVTSYRNAEWGKGIHPADLLGIAGKNPMTMLKISESSLRIRKYEEEVPMGRGPVIFLRDESYSVVNIKDQMIELEIALALAYNSEKRDFISIAWDSHHKRMHVYGESSPIPHLSQFYGGNTLIYHALDLAFDKADEYVKGTDLVVLTDGEIGSENPPKETQKKIDKFKEDGGRIWVIQVKDPSSRSYADSSMMPWMDSLIHIEDINESKELENLIMQANRRELVKGRKRL